MIVWLNGPFGGGKSTLAAKLRRALDGAVVADPEAIGDLLRRTLANHVRRPRHYQDLPASRDLTSAFVTGLARHTGGPVIVPMTVLNPTYAAELFTQLHQGGASFHHLVLHTTLEVLQERIEASEYPGDPERSEAVRAHRRRRAANYYEAAAGWMHADEHVINTCTLTPSQTLQHALAHLHAGCPSSLLSESDPR